MEFAHSIINFVQSNDWTWPVALGVGFILFLLYIRYSKNKKSHDAFKRVIEYHTDGSVWDVPDHHTGLRRR